MSFVHSPIRILTAMITVFVMLSSVRSANAEVPDSPSQYVEDAETGTIESQMQRSDACDFGVIIKQDESKDFSTDDFNLYGILAMFIALLSLIVSLVTYMAQKKTEKHTQNAPISTQTGKLNDLPRHFYRNLVCSFAMIVKFLDKRNISEEGKLKYPSESNMRKLETLPDDVILNIDADEKTYSGLHEFKLLLRNYNVEVSVASEHFSRRSLQDDSLLQDIDNLLFKPFFLVKSAYDLRSLLTGESSMQNVSSSVYIVLTEHFSKLRKNMETLFGTEPKMFLKAIFENGLSAYDRKNGFDRSIRQIYSYLSDNGRDEQSEDRLIVLTKDASGNLKTMISKSAFVSRIKADERQKELHPFVSALLNVKNAGDFRKLYDSYVDKKDKNYSRETPVSLYSDFGMSGYFDYLSGDNWEFLELLHIILAVDIAIETDRVGMINF